MGNYGILLNMGNAGFISSTVASEGLAGCRAVSPSPGARNESRIGA